MQAKYYLAAQTAMSELKAAVLGVVLSGPEEGMRNVEIGRALGIYGGHKGHQGHISRVCLQRLQEEVLLKQLDNKLWTRS